MSQNPMHLSPADFERRGVELLSFITSYWSSLDSPAAPPVLSQVRPGEVLRALPKAAPEHPEPWDDVMRDVREIIVPGLTHWQSPNFFAYFPANTSAPSVLADLLCAGLGVQGMLWATSPAATELETRLLDQMAQALGLPDRFRSDAPGESGLGIIQGTASEATLVALCAARTRARTRGGTGSLVAYTSTQAHSSVVKAAMIAGITDGPDAKDGFVASRDGGGVRMIAADVHYRLDPALLEAAMHADQAAGRAPFFVVATLGTTGVMAIDDLSAIAQVCAKFGAWLHVDAAFAGAALICPELRSMLGSGPPGSRGIDRADSFAFNPHKWLLVGFDCDLFWTSDRRAVRAALSITPEYLRNAASEAGHVIDYRDFQIPLGRRFRALKLWFVLRHYGLESLREYIREHLRLAALFEDLVAQDPRFELPLGPAFGHPLVCFRLREPGSDANRTLLRTLNESGTLYLTHTVLDHPASAPADARYVLRFAIGSASTRQEHIRAAWLAIHTTATAILAPSGGAGASASASASAAASGGQGGGAGSGTLSTHS